MSYLALPAAFEYLADLKYHQFQIHYLFSLFGVISLTHSEYLHHLVYHDKAQCIDNLR